MAAIKRALISVSDKTGIVELGKELASGNIEILSTGGTAKALRDAGVEVRQVSDYTGFPETLDGRVKTLHPKIHGGILGRRDLDSHKEQMKSLDIEPIDMVVVNLYPFEETIAKENVALEDAIENIDIGGPAMIRSAAKNNRDVVVVVDPDDYQTIIDEMNSSDGEISSDTRLKLAAKAYGHTAWYDGRITGYLSKIAGTGEKLPDKKVVLMEKSQTMRYGENPHQSAAFYKVADSAPGGISSAVQHHGKALSFNNIVDMAAAYELACEFSEPVVAIIKHTNPCGVARNESLLQAYITARDTDPVSSFGGVIAINKTVDKETAEEISKMFVEVIIAPGYDDDAMDALKSKKNIRVMELPLMPQPVEPAIKILRGGALIQDSDAITYDENALKVVSKRTPTDEEMEALKFAWTVAKHVKSNAIVYADANSTIGVGAGQMSRVDSAKIAAEKAQRSIKGAVMSSDAFFPFRDGIDAAGERGICAVIQPGGSVRDEEVIAAADEYDMAMVFTGIRHFRH